MAVLKTYINYQENEIILKNYWINPTCIGLIFANQKQLFMKSRTFITGMSDFYALTTGIMKLTYTKGNPKIRFYRDYKNFDNDLFQVDLEMPINITWDWRNPS